MAPDPETVVFAALAKQLGTDAGALRQDAERDLEDWGLDSHGLMAVLLAIEEALGLEELELDDDALASPASMAAAVMHRISG